jgi:hypothetical protein
LNGEKLSIGLGLDFAVLKTIATLYALILGTFANVNLVGATAAIGVAVAGLHGSKRQPKTHSIQVSMERFNRSSKKTCVSFVS